MATSDNYEGTAQFTAPAGGATTGTMLYDSTNRLIVLPMTTATSGNTYTAKMVGLVRAAPKLSTAAWTQGANLSWSTSTSQFIISTTGGVWTNANAFAAAATGDTTGDVVLKFPAAY